MDCSKVGRLISQLRKDKGLTQQKLAQALNISNKTVSKWECGLGYPDISLWTDLSTVLDVDMAQMMEGELMINRPDIGNINRIRFYVCPLCKNILSSTASSSILCCGRKLDPLTPQSDDTTPRITTEIFDIDYYFTFDHEMTREHYILFAAYVRSDTVILIRLYPEQNASVRMPYMPSGKLYLYCVNHGLSIYSIHR